MYVLITGIYNNKFDHNYNHDHKHIDKCNHNINYHNHV